MALGFNALCRMQGVKSSTPAWFNPAAAQLLSIEARRLMAPATAQKFLRLLDSGKVPNWVLSHVDLKLIKAAK